MIRLTDIPEDSLNNAVLSLQDEVDIRLSDLHLGSFTMRSQCGFYEARLTATRQDGKKLLTYVRIDSQELEGVEHAWQLWALVMEGVIVGIEDLNNSIEDDSFPAPAPLIPRAR
jgi:hypothetical protein